MKKVRVTVSQEFEIPDSWMVVTREEDGGQCFFIDGKLYRPDIEWWQFEERDDEGIETWVETPEVIDTCVVQASESIEEVDQPPCDNGED